MPSPGERLDRLAALVNGRVVGDPATRVVDVVHDSRAAGPGKLFVAIRGFVTDGHRFVARAVEAGATAVAVEAASEVPVPQLVLPDTRAALAPLAAAVHGHPSRRIQVVGVTGTDGKTSVTHLLENVARAAGVEVGVIGTIPGSLRPGGRTTPEASDFQRTLAEMADRGCRIVAAEVSSHALALGRVDDTRFAVAAFTNLSQDHLDFHRDLEDYFAAKARLFESGRTERAVIWTDDPYGRRLAESVAIPVVRVGTGPPADLVGRVTDAGLEGSRITLTGPLAKGSVAFPLQGRFNASNALVAAGCGLALGIPIESVIGGLESARPIPGRFEVVSGDDPVTVVVDYAHTPGGIRAVIAAARTLAAGRVIAVLGAGGDRDPDKRPLMGEAASGADLVVVTSDNPRSEDPGAIMGAVSRGVTAESRSIADRRAAIGWAVETARPGDLVLVLGKGHEQHQEVAGRLLPFDDRVVAREELERVRVSGP